MCSNPKLGSTGGQIHFTCGCAVHLFLFMLSLLPVTPYQTKQLKACIPLYQSWAELNLTAFLGCIGEEVGFDYKKMAIVALLQH